MGSNSRKLSWFVIIVENSFFTWASSVWESVMVCLQIKLTIRLCVERLEKCHSYLMKNHEVGTKAQPTFLSETKYYVIVVLYVHNVRCGVWVGVT